MVSAPNAPVITLEGGTVTVQGELRVKGSAEFCDAMLRGLATGCEELVLDLARVEQIASRCLAPLARVLVEARDAGQRVVILARAKVVLKLELVGLQPPCDLRRVLARNDQAAEGGVA
jgi:anti-anti-sigma regulatory factor